MILLNIRNIINDVVKIAHHVFITISAASDSGKMEVIMGKTKILVVDDEEHILELIQFNLEEEGFDVKTCDNGKDVCITAESYVPDLIILDIMLPGINGYQVCKLIRKSDITKDIPIIMLTVKKEEIDKVLGLELGADDYMTKPFGVRELIARINAVLRRYETKIKEKTNIIKVRDLEINLLKHEVLKKEKVIELTLREFNILKLLAENRGTAFSREEISEIAWQESQIPELRAIDVHIRNLRQKIEENDKIPDYIETVRGIGYKIR